MSQRQDARVAELERRIREIEALDDASLGPFGLRDWILCVVAGVLLPVAALWWFAG